MEHSGSALRGTALQILAVVRRGRYPYLGWATDHFLGQKRSPISNRDYPLTWEIAASQARYEGMAIIDPVFVTQRTAAPHTWHAAEIFLYVLKQQRDPLGNSGTTDDAEFTDPQ